MVKFIDGKKVFLRPVFKSDLTKDYLRWINDRSNDGLTNHAMFPHTLKSLRNFFEANADNRNGVWLAIVAKSNNRHVGNIQLANIDFINRNAEYRILVDKKAHGKGYGFEASRLLIGHGFKVLNLHRIYLGVHQDNQPAIGLYKKLGFKPEGISREHFIRDGKYRNILKMGLLSREYQ